LKYYVPMEDELSPAELWIYLVEFIFGYGEYAKGSGKNVEVFAFAVGITRCVMANMSIYKNDSCGLL